MNFFRISLATLLLAAFSLSAKAAELKGVTTFLPGHCWTAAGASGQAQVENLMEGTVGPHEFQLAPSHLRKLNGADLIVCIGLELEPWLETMIEKGSLKKGVQVLNLGETLDKKLLISSEEGEEASEAAHEGEDSHDSDAEDHDHAHEHGLYDPHIWLDPVLAQECVKLITARLEQMAPEKAPAFRKNAEQYNQKLSQLDNVLKESLKEVQQKPFYTQHDAFSYFNKRYGLKCVGVLQKVPDSDVSPRHLSALLKKIKEEGVVAIFLPSKSADRLAERLAQDGKIKIGRLETLETLDEGPLNADAYERMMKGNLKALLESLK
jgi:ABC-type Zn uptake system ZnuABC Zn-binding protein ZnuA